MEIFIRKSASVMIRPESPKARPGGDRAGGKGEYQEFLFGLNILLGDKWYEKNPFVDEFGSSRCTSSSQDGRPAKQLQTLETANRERVLSAIHQKEMTKWQTHP